MMLFVITRTNTEPLIFQFQDEALRTFKELSAVHNDVQFFNTEVNITI